MWNPFHKRHRRKHYSFDCEHGHREGDGRRCKRGKDNH